MVRLFRLMGLIMAVVAVCLMCLSCGNGSNNDNERRELISTSVEESSDTEEEDIDISGKLNGHAYVDLGLPSGTLWATCNVGANSPTEYGNYYSWGETETKSNYSKNTYSYYGTPVTLSDNNDVAHIKWGETWRIPTKDDFDEIKNNCDWEWTIQSGQNGYKVIGPNGKSIFLPAAGNHMNDVPYYKDTYCLYWLSTSASEERAWYCELCPDHRVTYKGDRYLGLTIRPVCVSDLNQSHTQSNDENGWVDLGLPSGTLWATCNVGANSPEEYGDFFAWGETKPKDTYLYYNYTYHENTTVLPNNSDVASVRLGNGWRIPTKNEFEELQRKCTWTMTIMKGKKGYKVTGSNGCYIFIPAAGYYTWRDVGFQLSDGSTYDGYDGEGSIGRYWSSSIDENDTEQASYLLFNFDYDPKFLSIDNIDRYYGHSIRPVYKGLNGSSGDGYGSNQQYEKDDLSWIQGNWRYVARIYGVTVEERIGIYENMIVVMYDGEFDYRGSYSIEGNQLVYYYGDGTAGYIVIDRVNRRLMFDDTHAFQRF